MQTRVICDAGLRSAGVTLKPRNTAHLTVAQMSRMISNLHGSNIVAARKAN
jgi:hypothetical protein